MIQQLARAAVWAFVVWTAATAIIVAYWPRDTVTLEDGSIVNTSYGAPVDTGD